MSTASTQPRPAPTTAWLADQLPAMKRALEALVAVNSFSGNPEGGREVGRRLRELFGLPGLVEEVVPGQAFADHLVWRSSGHRGAPVALVGHLDTVFAPGTFEGFRDEGATLRGPGVLDMKGGLVVMAWALKAVTATVGLDAIPPLRVVVVSDEEVGSPEGGPVLRRALEGCGACLVFESGRANDAIITQRKGLGCLFVRVRGKAAHAGNSYFDGANAIWALARYVDAAQQLSDAAAGTTVNVGVIKGGTVRNTVPDEASAELDLRYATRGAREALITRLKELANEVAVPGTVIDLEEGPGRLPMERTEASAALLASYARCAAAAGLQYGEAPRQGGGSDGNTAASMGIPTIDALGPRGTGFHTHDEQIEAATLVSRAQALALWLCEGRALTS